MPVPIDPPAPSRHLTAVSLIQSFRLVLSKPHRAATPFLGGGIVVAALGVLLCAAGPARLGGVVLGVGLVFTLFCLYFFRDPERTPPPRPCLALAPADGRVVSVERAVPPGELGLGGEPRWRIAIFLSVLNVHVNRAPADAQITAIAYRPGKFVNASLDKASVDNERNALALRLHDGRDLAVVQIAGLIARRILCDARVGDELSAGARFGIIRFGSRTDLYLPHGVEPLVVVGQTMVGGETVLADLAPGPAPRSGVEPSLAPDRFRLGQPET